MVNFKNVDLHIHSYFSDGADSPEEIKKLAVANNLELFSITDHNFISPEIKLLESKDDGRIELLQGIEISSIDRKTGQSLHILGYSKNFNIEKINSALIPVVIGYNERAKKIIEKLNKKFGSNFNFEEIKNEIPAVFVSRTLLAKKIRDFLNNKITFAEAIEEAFMEEDHSWLIGVEDAIKLINENGGMAVLAHPGNLFDKVDVNELVDRLTKYGLKGVEVFYPKHNQEVENRLIEIAEKYNLLVAGGSDWHGEGFSKFPMGIKLPKKNYEAFIKI